MYLNRQETLGSSGSAANATDTIDTIARDISLREDHGSNVGSWYARRCYLCSLKSLRLTGTGKNRAGRTVCPRPVGPTGFSPSCPRSEFKKSSKKGEKSMRFRCRYAYPFALVPVETCPNLDDVTHRTKTNK